MTRVMYVFMTFLLNPMINDREIMCPNEITHGLCLTSAVNELTSKHVNIHYCYETIISMEIEIKWLIICELSMPSFKEYKNQYS